MFFQDPQFSKKQGCHPFTIFCVAGVKFYQFLAIFPREPSQGGTFWPFLPQDFLKATGHHCYFQ
jgi:hypothetical protein